MGASSKVVRDKSSAAIHISISAGTNTLVSHKNDI